MQIAPVDKAHRTVSSVPYILGIPDIKFRRFLKFY